MMRRPLFLEYNGSEEFTGKHWHTTPLKRQLARCERAVLWTASKIFVVSDVDRRDLIARGIPAERIILNPNGVSPERFTAGGGPAVRHKLGFSSDDVVVGLGRRRRRRSRPRTPGKGQFRAPDPQNDAGGRDVVKAFRSAHNRAMRRRSGVGL
jgi:glycosyltransferase involved in cell wall biosynthesis